MKVSVCGFSFYNTQQAGKMDVFGYLESVRYRYGLNAVDLWNGQFCMHDPNKGWTLPDESVLNKIREGLEERELQLINVAVDSAHIWEDDPDKREWLHENAVKHIHTAGKLGAKSVRVDTGAREDNTFSEEQFEFIVKRSQEYCLLAGEYGMMFGPENHMGPTMYPKELVRLAKAVNCRNYGILHHMNRWRGDKEIGDELVAPYAYHTHIEPYVVFSSNPLEQINVMKKHGYDGYWAVENNFKQKNQYTEMEWLLAGLKRVLTHSEAGERE